MSWKVPIIQLLRGRRPRGNARASNNLGQSILLPRQHHHFKVLLGFRVLVAIEKAKEKLQPTLPNRQGSKLNLVTSTRDHVKFAYHWWLVDPIFMWV